MTAGFSVNELCLHDQGTCRLFIRIFSRNMYLGMPKLTHLVYGECIPLSIRSVVLPLCLSD